VSVLDALGPVQVRVQTDNGTTSPVELRPQVRLLGGVTLEDEPTLQRARMRFPQRFYRTVTIGGVELARTSTPWVRELSEATLVRLEPHAEVEIEGMADAVSLGGSYVIPRAEPNVPVKFLANAGAFTVFVRPPLAATGQMGYFADSLALEPGETARIAWDQTVRRYRIQLGPRSYIVHEGDHVTFGGERIFIRS
jgi:hypothetical protein